MDKNKDSEKSIVQFNVVNTTSNTISVDLFDLATLNSTPTQPNYINPPNSVYSNFSVPFVPRKIVTSNNSNVYIINIIPSNTLLVYDINNVLISTINLGVALTNLVYNSTNNCIYVADNTTTLVYVINCSTNTLISTIPYPNTSITFTSGTTFNYLNNKIYFVDNFFQRLNIIDCSTNTFSGVVTGVVVTLGGNLELNPNLNILYLGTTSTNVQVIDCNTNLVIGTLPIISISITFNYLNNNLYFTQGGSVGIYNTSTNTFLSSIPTITTPSTIGAFDYQNNYIYYGSSSQYVHIINANDNTLLNSLNVGGVISAIPNYDNFSQSVLFLNSAPNQIIKITTTGITSSPYYVTGAVNYNYFVQNLQNEPIIVSKVRVISPQTQLDNVANILTIDSSGKQYQYPVIPLLTVSAWQEQGTISELKFKELVFDGRTFISNYLINPNTSVILEIHFEQLDNTKIRYLGKMLPKKVPLKGFFDDYVDLSM